MRFRWFCIDLVLASASGRARKEALPDIRDISEQDIAQYWDIIADMTPEEIDELFGRYSTRTEAEIVRDVVSAFVDSDPDGSPNDLYKLVNRELVAAGHHRVDYKKVWGRLRTEKRKRGLVDTKK